MKIVEILAVMSKYIAENCKLDQHRQYLGMSGIADKCPEIYHRYKNGIGPIDEKGQNNSYRGYMIESEVKKWLESRLCLQSYECVADFDKRFIGHLDGVFWDGDILEIKSMSTEKFQKVKESGKLPFKNWIQVQCYLKYKRTERAMVVIVCTSTLERMVLSVQPNKAIQARIEAKAKYILECIDQNKVPDDRDYFNLRAEGYSKSA